MLNQFNELLQYLGLLVILLNHFTDPIFFNLNKLNSDDIKAFFMLTFFMYTLYMSILINKYASILWVIMNKTVINLVTKNFNVIFAYGMLFLLYYKHWKYMSLLLKSFNYYYYKCRFKIKSFLKCQNYPKYPYVVWTNLIYASFGGWLAGLWLDGFDAAEGTW